MQSFPFKVYLILTCDAPIPTVKPLNQITVGPTFSCLFRGVVVGLGSYYMCTEVKHMGPK